MTITTPYGTTYAAQPQRAGLAFSTALILALLFSGGLAWIAGPDRPATTPLDGSGVSVGYTGHLHPSGGRLRVPDPS